MVDLGPTLQAALSEHYTVERELGRGGMATVFLAQDLKHQRPVAIKVLRPEIAGAIGAERFLREIETAAQLHHPHILPLFDSGEADGLLYYVMPYVAGESLQDRLAREKQLPLEDALQIARNVAAALAHAHSLGIVHRDIKPGNIMLEGGEAVVADFGIARAVTYAGGEHLTETGITLGTPAYMSPEQAGGEENIDGRSDVYALGCVLFEMLAGEPPFTGPTAQAIIARHMREEPRSLSVVRPSVPPSVDYAVQKALAKVPADRPLTAERFVDLFEAPVPDAMERDRSVGPRWFPVLVGTIIVAAATLIGLWRIATTGEPATDRVSAAASFDPTRIAVLYFDDHSEGRELGYLASGVTEAVIHELSQVPALQVISRNGVKPYQDTPVTLDSVARALRVGTVIEGSVTRSGQILRVTAQIIETAGMTHLASLSRDRPWGDWLAIVDEIVGDVAREFREELGVEILQRERRARSANPQAWELFHRADQLREDHRPLMLAGNVEAAEQTLSRADSLLALAASLDPSWIEPVIQRGWVAGELAALLGPTPGVYDQTWTTRGLQFAAQALEREEQEPEALELRGTLRYHLWKASESPDTGLLASAEGDFRRVVESNPRQASAWATLSELLHEAKGDFRGAKHAASRAYEEDAFLADAREIIFRLSNTSLELEQYEDAVRWAEEGRRRFPDWVDFVALELAIMSQGTKPNVPLAWELVEEGERLMSPQNRPLFGAIFRMQVAAVLARAGLPDSARAVIRRTRSQAPSDPEAYIAYDEAHAWLLLGERSEAFRALRMYLEASPQEKAYIAEDPWFQALRDDPRFAELVGSGG